MNEIGSLQKNSKVSIASFIFALAGWILIGGAHISDDLGFSFFVYSLIVFFISLILIGIASFSEGKKTYLYVSALLFVLYLIHFVVV